jgi:hypothetical protein
MNESSDLEASAGLFDVAADELELAAQHCRTASGHFREKEVARGAAHAWAALGHVLNAQEQLERQARIHAANSNP